MVGVVGLILLATGCSNSNSPTPSGNLEKRIETIEIEFLSIGNVCSPESCPSFDVKVSLDGKGEYHSLQRLNLPPTRFIVPNENLSKLFSTLHPFRVGGVYPAPDDINARQYCGTDSEVLSVRWLFADATTNTLQQDFKCEAPADLTRTKAIMTALGLLPIASFAEQDFSKSSYRELLRDWETK